jgi:hypothetical protein
VHLAELRTSLNKAQQLTFETQFEHSEDLIRELDTKLHDLGQAASSGQLRHLITTQNEDADAGIALKNAARLVGSSLAQLTSAARMSDKKHLGVSALETAQSLRTFVDAVHGVALAYQGRISLDRYVCVCIQISHYKIIALVSS